MNEFELTIENNYTDGECICQNIGIASSRPPTCYIGRISFAIKFKNFLRFISVKSQNLHFEILDRNNRVSLKCIGNSGNLANLQNHWCMNLVTNIEKKQRFMFLKLILFLS